MKPLCSLQEWKRFSWRRNGSTGTCLWPRTLGHHFYQMTHNNLTEGVCFETMGVAYFCLLRHGRKCFSVCVSWNEFWQCNAVFTDQSGTSPPPTPHPLFFAARTLSEVGLVNEDFVSCRNHRHFPAFHVRFHKSTQRVKLDQNFQKYLPIISRINPLDFDHMTSAFTGPEWTLQLYVHVSMHFKITASSLYQPYSECRAFIKSSGSTYIIYWFI